MSRNFSEARARMVKDQLEPRGIRDPRVLEAMAAVPRERFVPSAIQGMAYDDRAMPIGHAATISQPYIVALMSELAEAGPGKRILEVGTGSGYQAAVLAEMGAEVYSLERVEALHERAAAAFRACGYDIHQRHGDGFEGWPEAAPFDTILLTAAPEEIPAGLVEQLRVGGKLIAPVGARWVQSLVVIERSEDGDRRRHIADVAFVPMVPGTVEA